MPIIASTARLQFVTTTTNGAGETITIPLASGKVYTYINNTTTNQTTYSDADGQSANANPVILDSSGAATIFLDPTLTYTFKIDDSSDNTIATVNDIAVSESTTTSLSDLDADIDLNGNAFVTSSNLDVKFAPSGSGVLEIITEDGTYEDRVTNDDDIVNKRYVDDKISRASKTEVHAASSTTKFVSANRLRYSPYAANTQLLGYTNSAGTQFTPLKSLNIKGIEVDAANEEITIKFKNPYKNNNYQVLIQCVDYTTAGAYRFPTVIEKFKSEVVFTCHTSTPTKTLDDTEFHVVIFGELA